MEPPLPPPPSVEPERCPRCGSWAKDQESHALRARVTELEATLQQKIDSHYETFLRANTAEARAEAAEAKAEQYVRAVSWQRSTP